MLTIQEIKELIRMDGLSPKKQEAKTGQRYYEGEHDIKKYRLYYFDSDGRLCEDKHRSNVKIPHPFFTEIVDQSVQYIFSGDRFIRAENERLQRELDDYFNFNEDFTANLQELLTGCMVKGSEYMYMYKNSLGRTAFQCCDSLRVIEVSPANSDDGEEYLIYIYTETAGKGKRVLRHILVWDKSSVHYFVEKDGDIRGDESESINPRPHNLYMGTDEKMHYGDFGRIPFFRLDNNPLKASDLCVIKELIDDYDLMASSLSNNLIDFDTPLYAVSGFEGDSLEELRQNLSTKKIIGLDEGGNVDIKTVSIPYEARKEKLELDEKNIYRFGMGLNTSGLRDTASTTNIAIKAAYSLLDLKCRRLETRLKRFLRELSKPVIDEINMRLGTAFTENDIRFEFRHEVMSNAMENAQIEKLREETVKMRLENISELAKSKDGAAAEQKLRELIREYDVQRR